MFRLKMPYLTIVLCCMSVICDTKTYAQIEITLDVFLACALGEKSDAMRMIDAQSEINQLDYALSYESFLPTASLSLNGPTYSKTISPITQPDGSVCYRQVNSMNESVSVSLSVPINPTGGSLSLQSSVSAYQHFSNGATSMSISVNYYRLSLSQPLNFYSENKWNRKLLGYSHRQKEIENKDAYHDELYECTRSYFDMVICQLKDSLLHSELASYEVLASRLKDELKVGRTLEAELEEVNLKCEELRLQILDNETEYKSMRDYLSSKYGLIADAVSLWVCPGFPPLELNIEQTEQKALAKFEAQSAYAIESQRKNIEKLKRTRWGSPSLSANVGLSSSSSDFDDLKNHIGKDYGAGAGFSLSITGLSSNKKELRRAELQNECLLISNDLKRQNLLYDLRSDFQRYHILASTYRNNVLRELILTKKLEIATGKHKLQHILLDEVEDVIFQISQTRISQIENIRDSYLLISNINKKTTD